MGLFDRLRGEDHPRVAFVGIDGVPFSLLEEHPEEFPNFAALECRRHRQHRSAGVERVLAGAHDRRQSR